MVTMSLQLSLVETSLSNISKCFFRMLAMKQKSSVFITDPRTILSAM